MIFGDSIAKGVGCESGGWSALLTAETEVSNLAADGERAEDTLSKLRVSEAGGLAIIATGVNNCGEIIGKDGETIAPDIESFEIDYRDILSLAKQKFERVVAIGLIPTEGTVMPLGEGAVVQYDNAIIGVFNDKIAKLCAELGVDFIGLLPHFLGRESELLTDHIHPNDQGHQIILSEIIKAGIKL